MRPLRLFALFALTALGSAACQPIAAPPAPTGNQPQPLGGGGAQFENVPVDNADPFQGQNLSPSIAARMHSCQKIPYDTLGALLTSRGVNLNAGANGRLPSAGQVYKAGAATLGAPNYATRTREVIAQTTSGATKLMDVFLMAAPEIIGAMPGVAACKVRGVPAQMFDNNGLCTKEGVACLVGGPATQAHVDLCNQIISEET